MVERPTQSGVSGSNPTPPLQVFPIASQQSSKLIIANHYSGRAANASFAYGLFENENLVGAVTFGHVII